MKLLTQDASGKIFQSSLPINEKLDWLNLFVDPAGDDTNNGRSAETPFATASRAALEINVVSRLTDTQTISVTFAAGSYDSFIVQGVPTYSTIQVNGEVTFTSVSLNSCVASFNDPITIQAVAVNDSTASFESLIFSPPSGGESTNKFIINRSNVVVTSLTVPDSLAFLPPFVEAADSYVDIYSMVGTRTNPTNFLGLTNCHFYVRASAVPFTTASVVQYIDNFSLLQWPDDFLLQDLSKVSGSNNKILDTYSLKNYAVSGTINLEHIGGQFFRTSPTISAIPANTQISLSVSEYKNDQNTTLYKLEGYFTLPDTVEGPNYEATVSFTLTHPLITIYENYEVSGEFAEQKLTIYNGFNRPILFTTLNLIFAYGV